MKNKTIGLLLVTTSSLFAAPATYELRRITVLNNGQALQTRLACSLSPGKVVHESQVGGVSTQATRPFSANDATVQQLVEKVTGIERPDFKQAEKFTNWWVRSAPDAAFKLVRSNVQTKAGSKIYTDPSASADVLSHVMGYNCFRVFGE